MFRLLNHLYFLKNNIRHIPFNLHVTYIKKGKKNLSFRVPLEKLDKLQFNLPMISTPRKPYTKTKPAV